MDQQSNMPRDTAETLKQIQKKGLSVSIVTPPTPASFSLPSPASSENRSKQNVLLADKTSKSTPIVPRPQNVTENKAQILPATRLPNNAESRVSTGRTQTAFHDTKTTQNQSKPNQATLSESKGFNPAWNVHMPIPDKSQGSTSRPVVTTPVSKMQTGPARVLIPDNKTPFSRGNQSMLAENKTQARVTPGQRIPQNQHLIEGKAQTNQDKVNVNPTSPPEAKVFPNQARTSQQFIITPDNKTIPVQRVNPLKSTDLKNVSQMCVNKQDIKSAQVNRLVQNVKVTSEITQNKGRQNFIIKDDGKLNAASNSPMIVENKMNSIRMVSNTVDNHSSHPIQSKSSTQARLPPNASGSETQTAVQTKMMISTVHTKMICIRQSVTDNKVILQGGQTQTASDMIQKTSSTVIDMSTEASSSNSATPVSSRIATPKRSSAFNTSPAKKKCVKRVATSTAEMTSKNVEGSNMSSSEEGNENAAQLFNNLKKVTRTGLTITPVQSSIPSMPSSTSSAVNMLKVQSELVDKDAYRLAFEKAQILRYNCRGKSRARGRRRYIEPVCLALSSDDEEEHMQAQFNNFAEAFASGAQIFPRDSEEGSKSGQSSPAYQEENDPGCDDDPEFPGVTDITYQRTPDHHFPGSEEEFEEEEEDEEERDLGEMEGEEDDGMGEEEEEMNPSEIDEEEGEDEEEVPPEEEEEQSPIKGPLENLSGFEQPLRCRSVRIGSFKVHPKPANTFLSVFLASDGISFNAPMVSDSNKMVNFTVKPSDITQMLVHFGKCLPILFVSTTPSFAEATRKSLNMTENKLGYYDPTSNDEKTKKITFLIDNINEEQRKFLKHNFLTDKKVKELDQKTANDILVKSTPSQIITRCEVAQSPPQPIPFPPENIISVTTIQMPVTPRPPPQPVTKLLTYPPPPQTGGILITNEDLACLNEGEFLNDAIIDFYLKYIYNEKLSEYHREKTHIFSSYFFPRLTNKPERARPEDVPKNVQMRRHSQVKTWTRHVDIFSKDFIIIPVNQNVHWFLAIVCYPGLVPEAPESSIKTDSKTNKSCDNVTSSDDQEETKQVKEANSTVDGTPNSDENSVASNSSMYEQAEADSEETLAEAADSSTHPEIVLRQKEVPCICIFDSLNGPNRSRIVTLLREYLEIEWQLKKGTRKVFDKTTMQGYIVQCPQQNNYSDCGIYVLQYVESFFENPIPYFDSPIPNLSNWFPKEKMVKKRQELKDLILSLQKKYSSSTVARNTNASESTPPQAQAVQTDNR